METSEGAQGGVVQQLDRAILKVDKAEKHSKGTFHVKETSTRGSETLPVVEEHGTTSSNE